MASNAAASGGAREDPLSSFTRISKIVYLYRPSTDRNPSGSPSPSPKLILVGGWMDAREPHLAKYTASLQALFPASPILLVRSFRYHFTGRRFPGEIEPAVPLIRSILAAPAEADSSKSSSSSSRRPEMLIQVFSNGGSTMLSLLYELYRRPAASGGSAAAELPPHVTIFDSGPGLFRFRRSVTAFSLAVARRSFIVRLLVKSLIVWLCTVYWVLNVPWGRPGFLNRMWLAHNDVAKNRNEARRVYLYSKEDQLVHYKDVEEHAGQARQRGYQPQLEEFEGTPHVAHIRGNEQRYCAILKEAWDRAIADETNQ